MIPAPFIDAHMQLDKRKSLNTVVLAMAGRLEDRSNSYEQYYPSTDSSSENRGAGVIQVLTICFFICACVVSSNANAGFNVILTAMMYVAYVGLLAVVFNRKRATDGGMDTAMAIEPMVGGGLIGVTTMMCFLSLMTAVYWGQMSGCEDDTDDVEGYSCYNSFGMAAVAWFASFLLISEAVTLAALILWKEDIFFVDGGYDNFDAQEDRGAYSSSAYAYDGATFGTGGMGGGLGGGGGMGGGGDDVGVPQQADL